MCLLERLVGDVLEQLGGHIPVDACGHDPGSGGCAIEVQRGELPRIRRPRPRDHQEAFRPALARVERFEAKPGIAGEDILDLRRSILWKIAEYEHELVFDIETEITVITEVLALGDGDAVSGEDDRTFNLASLREREPAKRLGGSGPPS